MKRCVLVLMLGVLLLTACQATPSSNTGTAQPPAAPTIAPTEVATVVPTLESAPVGPLPSGVEAVLALYAESVGVSPDTLTVVSYEAVEFPDGCLGAASAGEMCTAAITPGYIIVVDSNGVQTTIHSNLEGTFFRIP